MLVLDEPSRGLAEAFHAHALGAGHAHPVLARWARAASFGLRPDSAAHTEGTSGSDLALRRDRLAEIFREERAMLAPIAAELAARALVAIIADPDGVILVAHGGGEFSEHAARVSLVEGARWSEGTRGTNAIGTAITERRAIAVLGGAHYEERNRELFCYATPLRDAYGDVIAVLDVTGRIERHDPAVGLAVQTSGAALEHALRARAFAATSLGGLSVIEKLVHRCRGPAFLVEATGDVRLTNEAARAALQSAGDTLTCEAIFGESFATLTRLAHSHGGMRFETRHTRFEVEIDPILGEGGRALAALVHLEAVPASVRMRVAREEAPSPVRVSAEHPAFAAILGDDAHLVKAKGLATRFAQTRLPVLLLAETGTGKELFARAIHAASPRAHGPLVAVNCGALTPSLLESELFGYAPGAFTGATRAGSDGKLGAADGGTLLLDEIADMPEALQVALLRVLDDGVYQRVGDTRSRKADFRLVCATCRDLPAMVERGAFRRDLFYRIQGACISLPPLRERTDRVALAKALVHAMAQPAPELTRDALAWIESHAWPGNVRELKSALEHACALAAPGEPITREHFPAVLLGEEAHAANEAGETREAILRAAIVAAVEACAGNVSKAARRLGVARTTVYRALQSQKR